MASTIDNWALRNEKVSDAALKAAEKQRILEKKRRKAGWRWIRLSPRTKVFVPCDESGEPTEVWRRIIENAMKTCV